MSSSHNRSAATPPGARQTATPGGVRPAFSKPVSATERPAFGERVLRGGRAGIATSATFDVDLRGGVPEGDAETRSEMYAEAKASGYAAGWAEGRRAAGRTADDLAERTAAEAARRASEHTAAVRRAITALSTAAARLDDRTVAGLEEIGQAVVGAAFAIAEAVIGRELATATDPGTDAIERVLASVPPNGPVMVRLHPADLATLVENVGSTTQTIDGRTVTLISDPSLGLGDAIAECEATRVEARITDAVARIRAALLSGLEVTS